MKLRMITLVVFELDTVIAEPSRPTQRAPDPWESTRTIVVGVGAFSSSWRGLRLIPSKWRPLVPPASPAREERPRGRCAVGNAHRWAANCVFQLMEC